MEIRKNVKNGKEYTNINLGDMEDKETISVIKEAYNEAKEINGKYGKGWTCKVIYNDTVVSFISNDEEFVKKFNTLGGLGDTYKLTMSKSIIKVKNKDGTTKDGVKKVVSIEKVE